MSVEVSHETGAPVAEESRRQGISVEALPERLLSESVTLAHAGVARELPLCHPGALGSLHRRDICDDVG